MKRPTAIQVEAAIVGAVMLAGVIWYPARLLVGICANICISCLRM